MTGEERSDVDRDQPPRKSTTRRRRRNASAQAEPKYASPLYVRWRNFRGFDDTGWIELSPVTAVIGPNNSGKTSLHAPLLLLKQSLEESGGATPLALRGRLINLGRFEDCLRDHDPTLEMSLALRWFGPATASPQDTTLGRDAPASVSFDFALREGRAVLARFRASDVHDRMMVERTLEQDGTYDLKGLTWATKGKGAAARKRDRRFQEVLKADRPEAFLFSPDSVLGALLRTEEVDADSPTDTGEPDILQRISATALAYFQVMNFVQDRVTDILRCIDYLGPLRAAPQRTYELPSGSIQAVGSKGEHTAEVFCTGSESYRSRVNDWLGTIDPSLSIRCHDLAPNGIVALEVVYSDRLAVNMADVGFGLGQVLPIAVAALADASPDDETRTLVMEQPEIHLNPRVQARLADLASTMAVTGKRAYIETHSEHFLTRLRTIIASGTLSDSSVSLYFVEKDGLLSRVRRISMTSLGHIEESEWPSGFFDEGLRSALELVQTQRARVVG